MDSFEWNEQRNTAAVRLAEGALQKEVAKELGITDRTIRYWLTWPEFAIEVDRLSIMVGISNRAQRLRWANRTILSKLNPDGSFKTDKDALDWLKYGQSETDGAKIDLSKLAEMLTGETGDNQQPLALPASGMNQVGQPQDVVPTSDDDINPS